MLVISRARTQARATGNAGRAVALLDAENDGVAFDEDFGCAVLGKQFVHRVVKTQAEVAGGILPALDQCAAEQGGVSHVGLEHHVREDAKIDRLLLFRQEKLVEPGIGRRELAQAFGGDEVHLVHAGVERLQPAHVAVVTQEIDQEAAGDLGPLGLCPCWRCA